MWNWPFLLSVQSTDEKGTEQTEIQSEGKGPWVNRQKPNKSSHLTACGSLVSTWFPLCFFNLPSHRQSHHMVPFTAWHKSKNWKINFSFNVTSLFTDSRTATILLGGNGIQIYLCGFFAPNSPKAWNEHQKNWIPLRILKSANQCVYNSTNDSFFFLL